MTDFPAIKAMLETHGHGTATANAAWREYEAAERLVSECDEHRNEVARLRNLYEDERSLDA